MQTVKKPYNTTDVNGKRIDGEVNRRTFNAICSLNHLTPASEAAMENLLVPGSAVVPTEAETILRNSPDFIETPVKLVLPMPVDLDAPAESQPAAATPSAEAYEFD